MVLRQVVFVLEQNCVYLDCDGVDRKAHHLLGRDGDKKLVAYARLMAPGVTYNEACIGRVVTHPDARRKGIGRGLMTEAIARAHGLFGEGPIRIGAQRYLEPFYSSFGFETAGDPYIEDGIPHIQMLRK